jgi:hypothetical protein
MPTSPKRVAANRANARRSTGPKSPEGKARASQNARKHFFDPEPFAIVRIEDSAHIAALVADAVATYQPINSQERFAVERIALAQHSMLRMYTFEAGFFTNCLEPPWSAQRSRTSSNAARSANIESRSPRTALSGSPTASISSTANPMSPPPSSASRPRPSASTRTYPSAPTA